MVIIGSGSVAQFFMQHGLIDEYLLNVNPVILGNGKPLFKNMNDKINLKLLSAEIFNSGVIGFHYSVIDS